MTKDYCALIETSSGFSVCLYVEHPEIMAIGQRMEELCPEAYMNGYNWEAFIQHYLQKNAPQLLEGMGSDPEAGMYVAYYGPDPANKEKAQHLQSVITELVEQPDKIIQFLEQEGDQIAWD